MKSKKQRVEINYVVVFLLPILLFFSCNLFKQNTKSMFMASKSNLDEGYYITHVGDTSLGSNFIFPFENWKPLNKLDTLAIIEELLKFQGDTRKCYKGMTYGTNPLAKKYRGRFNEFSIQVEALYIINYFYFEGFTYSPFPSLIDTTTGREEAIQGEIVDKAYELYKIWYNILKDQGIILAKKNKIYPLENSSIRWY